MREATAFAPATCGNAAVGFDVLGFAVDAVGDTVTVSRRDERSVRITEITGVVRDLPTDAAQNTATVGLVKLIDDLELDHGFDVRIDKGIAIGSGMGGSAASAVAALVAANALLDTHLPDEDLFDYALVGEAVSSGHAHPDNVAPCLYGGLTYTVDGRVRQLPTPPLYVALIHPHLRVDTRAARAALPAQIPLGLAVRQMAELAAFIDACHRSDGRAVARHSVDHLAQPHRAPLVTGFDSARDAALGAGAEAFSLSGSGPTVFALAHDIATATRVRDAVVEAFQHANVAADGWVSPFGAQGARLV